jgi:GTP-binding protein
VNASDLNSANTPTAEEIEAGRALFAQACSFVTAAANAEDLPPTTLPEVAFAGRSNVGKSSLLNALTGRKTLARTSHTPGRTRQVNFFDMAGRLLLVDLPGYGYARASKSEVQRWTALIDNYLKGRPQLRRVLLLIDSRHGLKDIDLRVMAQLDEAAVSYQIVLTKADKPKPGELAAVTARILSAIAKRPAAHPQIAVTSANAGTGVAELRAAIAALANESKAV